MSSIMITENRQIVLPEEICKKLGVTIGDKVAFIEEDGKILLVSSTIAAFREAQEAFKGEAERLGLKDMDDVVAMIKEVRKEIADEKAQNHG